MPQSYDQNEWAAAAAPKMAKQKHPNSSSSSSAADPPPYSPSSRASSTLLSPTGTALSSFSVSSASSLAASLDSHSFAELDPGALRSAVPQDGRARSAGLVWHSHRHDLHSTPTFRSSDFPQPYWKSAHGSTSAATAGGGGLLGASPRSANTNRLNIVHSSPRTLNVDYRPSLHLSVTPGHGAGASARDGDDFLKPWSDANEAVSYRAPREGGLVAAAGVPKADRDDSDFLTVLDAGSEHLSPWADRQFDLGATFVPRDANEWEDSEEEGDASGSVLLDGVTKPRPMSPTMNSAKEWESVATVAEQTPLLEPLLAPTTVQGRAKSFEELRQSSQRGPRKRIRRRSTLEELKANAALAPETEPFHIQLTWTAGCSVLIFVLLHIFPVIGSISILLRQSLGSYPSSILLLALAASLGHLASVNRVRIARLFRQSELRALAAAVTGALLCTYAGPVVFTALHIICFRIPFLGPTAALLILLMSGAALLVVAVAAMVFHTWDITRVVHSIMFTMAGGGGSAGVGVVGDGRKQDRNAAARDGGVRGRRASTGRRPSRADALFDGFPRFGHTVYQPFEAPPSFVGGDGDYSGRSPSLSDAGNM